MPVYQHLTRFVPVGQIGEARFWLFMLHADYSERRLTEPSFFKAFSGWHDVEPNDVLIIVTPTCVQARLVLDDDFRTSRLT